MSNKPIKTRPISRRSFALAPPCVACYEDAAFEALFELENTIVVERYCEKCLPNAQR